MTDLEYQGHILQKVSRTYALALPGLPGGLREASANAYLLCRIADTIEDEPELALDQRREFWTRLVGLVGGGSGAAGFARELAAALSAATPEAERELAAGAQRVFRVTASLPPEQQAPIQRCLRIMCAGMAEFQGCFGLRDLAELDRYCYVVAGVVGEMMLELFCAHAPEVERRRPELAALCRSHGQGLQMANILKDIHEDLEHRRCWLPREVFAAEGFDLERLPDGFADPGCERGLDRLAGITRDHLANALRFILLIPPATGIRRPLLWSLALAVLSLRQFHRRRTVRLTRLRAGAAISLATALTRFDRALGWVFRVATRGISAAAGS